LLADQPDSQKCSSSYIDLIVNRHGGIAARRKLRAETGLDCVGYQVRKLNRIISSIYDEAFDELKLTISQFGILAMLSRRGPSTALELCRLMAMDKSTASRNLQRMFRRGWLSIRSEDGSRGQQLSLTGLGSRVLGRAYPLWRKAQAEATRRLGLDGLRALNTVLTRFTE
jgi:DNA-binding MarR family transcriptional regulator